MEHNKFNDKLEDIEEKLSEIESSLDDLKTVTTFLVNQEENNYYKKVDSKIYNRDINLFNLGIKCNMM